MKLDADRRIVGSRLVIVFQPLANFSSLYANYRIISGCVTCRTLKEVHSQGAFLDPLVVSGQAVVDHVRQKLLAALAPLKRGTVQDRIQFVKDRGFLKFIELAFFSIGFFAQDLVGRRIHGTHRLRFESAAIE